MSLIKGPHHRATYSFDTADRAAEFLICKNWKGIRFKVIDGPRLSGKTFLLDKVRSMVEGEKVVKPDIQVFKTTNALKPVGNMRPEYSSYMIFDFLFQINIKTHVIFDRSITTPLVYQQYSCDEERAVVDAFRKFLLNADLYIIWTDPSIIKKREYEGRRLDHTFEEFLDVCEKNGFYYNILTIEDQG